MDRISEEKKTIKLMIKIYCKNNHDSEEELCQQCEKLLNYAFKRLDFCKFGNNKGICGKCKIHCYKPDMREKIKEVMKFSAPRLLFYNPLMVIKHFILQFKKLSL